MRRQLIKVVSESITSFKVHIDEEKIHHYYDLQPRDGENEEHHEIVKLRRCALETERRKKRNYLIYEVLRELAYVMKSGVEHFQTVMGLGEDASDMTGANFFKQGLELNKGKVRSFAELQQK